MGNPLIDLLVGPEDQKLKALGIHAPNVLGPLANQPVPPAPSPVATPQPLGAIPPTGAGLGLTPPSAPSHLADIAARESQGQTLTPLDRFYEKRGDQPPQLHGNAKVADIAGRALYPGPTSMIESALPSTPIGYQHGLEQATEQTGKELGLQGTQAEVALRQAEAQKALQPPKPEDFTLGEGQARFDPTGKQIAAASPKPEKPDEFTLGPDQIRYGAGGNVIATGQGKTGTDTISEVVKKYPDYALQIPPPAPTAPQPDIAAWAKKINDAVQKDAIAASGARGAAFETNRPQDIVGPDQRVIGQWIPGENKLIPVPGTTPEQLIAAMQGGLAPKPTSTTITQGQSAAVVAQQAAPLIDQIKKLSSSIGPAVGRWNQLLVNKGGADFPQFAGLDTDLRTFGTGAARAHLGVRGAGGKAGEEYTKYLLEAQSPDDLIARINAVDGWMQGYARNAGVKDVSGAAAPTGGNTKQPPTGKSKVLVEGKDF